MDLVPELRCRVYECLLHEAGPIEIAVYKGRPVRRGFGYETSAKKANLVWSKEQAKWIDQPPGNLAVLGVSKQIHEEAASIAYDNEFSFSHPQYFKSFVRRIGSMCEHVKVVSFSEQTWYSESHSNPFLLLIKLSKLRKVKFGPTAFRKMLDGPGRSDSDGIKQLTKDIRVPLKMLECSFGESESVTKILDMFHVTSKRCEVCIVREKEREESWFRHPSQGSPSLDICTCEELRLHQAGLQGQLRYLIHLELKDKTPIGHMRWIMRAFIPEEDLDFGEDDEEVAEDGDSDDGGGATV